MTLKDCSALAKEEENDFANTCPQDFILKLGQWDDYENSQWEGLKGRDSRNDEISPQRPTIIDEDNHICLARMQNCRYPGIVAGMGDEIGPDGNPMTLPTAIQTIAAARASLGADSQTKVTGDLSRTSSALTIGGLARDVEQQKRAQKMVQEVAKSCKTITPPPTGHGRLYNHPLQDEDEDWPTHDVDDVPPTRPEDLEFATNSATAKPWDPRNTIRGASWDSHFLCDGRTGRAKRKTELDHEAQLMRQEKIIRSTSARSSRDR